MRLALDPIWSHRFDVGSLVAAHPPVRLPSRKRLVVEHACPPGRPHAGTLTATRWSVGDLPSRLVASPETSIEVVSGWFEYEPIRSPGIGEWHLNFASSSAFATYALPLFAQDEMQVLEHPALMSLYEALRAGVGEPRTVVGDAPTPVLVRGVERRCAIDTAPNARDGRPHGLYGNAFMAADPEAILRATRRLEPPTISHILAIEAPAGGFGPYRPEEIATILRTAWGGFAAVAEESAAAGARVTAIHTGYWGCGAYGGDRVLMTLLQVVAARAAGIPRLVLHAGSDDSAALEGVARAEELAGHASADPIGLDALVGRIADQGFEWGESNGT